MAKKQPGTMLYFDIRPSLKRLSNEEKGLLFEAILDYGEFGVVPDLDGPLGVAWDFIQPRLDRDRERYVEVSQKRTAAINARWDKARNKQAESGAIDTNEYKCIQTNTSEYKTIQTIPTTTTTSTPTSSSTTTSTPTGGGQQSRTKTKEQQFEDMRTQRMRMLLGGK